MCTGRVDLAFVLRAFEKGADGVIIGGCWPGECHYVTEGNYDALGNMHLGQMLLLRLGISPERLRLEWIAASEGSRFAELMSDFSDQLAKLGPLGQAEGLSPEQLRIKLGAAAKLVPFLKLVERERLRVPERTEAGIRAFYAREDIQALFDALVADKLAIGQILTLLAEQPLATGTIAERLAFSPSEVSRYMNDSSRQGLVRFDVENKCYALA